jgi:hypothetical protein
VEGWALLKGISAVQYTGSSPNIGLEAVGLLLGSRQIEISGPFLRKGLELLLSPNSVFLQDIIQRSTGSLFSASLRSITPQKDRKHSLMSDSRNANSTAKPYYYLAIVQDAQRA